MSIETNMLTVSINTEKLDDIRAWHEGKKKGEVFLLQ
jgi:hypothetical protein